MSPQKKPRRTHKRLQHIPEEHFEHNFPRIQLPLGPVQAVDATPRAETTIPNSLSLLPDESSIALVTQKASGDEEEAAMTDDSSNNAATYCSDSSTNHGVHTYGQNLENQIWIDTAIQAPMVSPEYFAQQYNTQTPAQPLHDYVRADVYSPFPNGAAYQSHVYTSAQPNCQSPDTAQQYTPYSGQPSSGFPYQLNSGASYTYDETQDMYINQGADGVNGLDGNASTYSNLFY
ncbi:hypothetical protein BDN70DRAFT_874170 [Pholiota conissans]|uniref:Uncharacterized protein n=1 Tax=Pholiota conissans TaxID=109636 RepID=A0A9P5ZAW4_9AGAR|nr:hypothetical protein BDN70DRAFT_874170 [Pholiota conissans]